MPKTRGTPGVRRVRPECGEHHRATGCQGRRAHQMCSVEMWPCRIDFSRRACAEISLMGRSTSMRRRGYAFVDTRSAASEPARVPVAISLEPTVETTGAGGLERSRTCFSWRFVAIVVKRSSAPTRPSAASTTRIESP